MYLHLCSYAGESCTFTVVFASILPDRFWGACYVRKYKLNFRNRELLEERQHFPTGAKSTCLGGENRRRIFLLRFYFFRPSYGQFNVPAAPSEYRNLTDFETVKECSSRRQSLVFVSILPSRLFIEMLGNGELNF